MDMKLSHTSVLKGITDFTVLPERYQAILSEAMHQLEFAYAPYSNFHVGAAVLLNNGKIFGGSNQENASYPLCMCGERVALYHAHGIHLDIPVEAIAITARNLKMQITKPVMPCGACRQVICEYEVRHKQSIKLFFLTNDKIVYECESGSSLLPFGFDQSFLF